MASRRGNFCGPLAVFSIIYILLCYIGDIRSGNVQATHFRGGTISWKPSDSFSLTYKEVIFTFKLGWRLSRIGCNEKTISSGTLVGEDSRWFCMYGCDGVVASTREKCTEFNKGDDWMYGGNTFKKVFEDDGPIEISYMECCWLTDLVVGAGGEWALTTTLNLGMRSDTGGPNSSPVTAMAPMITLRSGVPDAIDLAVRDSDGDRITCRLGRHVGECGTICSLFSEFTLDEENCLLRYNPVSNTTGKVPVALMVEDHHRSAGGITMGKKTFTTSDPLSAVPVQFLVILKVPPTNCADKPLIDASIPTNIPVKVRVGKNFTFSVSSTPCNISSSIDEFVLIAPIGVRKSPISEEDGVYTSEIKWTPNLDQDGSNLICVAARSSDGLLSDQVCVTVEVPKATGFCSVVSGSHFITFDKSRFDFYGMCKYLLVGTTPNAAVGLVPFNVTLFNEKTATGPSSVRVNSIEAQAFGYKIRVADDGGIKIIYLNDEEANLPIRTRDGLRAENSGRGISITLSLGIRIYVDDATLSVQLPQSYAGSVDGLCGNYNGEAEDDLIIRGENVLALNEAEFTTSYIVDDGEHGCMASPEKLRDEESCDGNALKMAHEKCKILIEENDGCFSKCHEVVDPENYYNNCKSVLCKSTDDYTAMDVLIRAYADVCQREEVTVCDWREETGIPMECPPNTHYESCATTVPVTCADSMSEISPVPSKSCIEGCICDKGYILSGSICVPESECGCIINEKYYPKGFTYRTEGCTTECVCGETCEQVSDCSGRQTCFKGSDGFYRCLDKLKESATCKAITDPHYETFDGTKFDSMGTCAYVMVRSKRNATKLTAFTVVAVNEQSADAQNASHVKEVHVSFGEGHILVFKQGPMALLNDKEVKPGTSIYGVEVRQIGRYLVADFNFGLVIRWDGIDMLRITAWSPLRYKVEGLCGDWDDNPDNDFAVRPTEENLPDAGSFAQSWNIEGYGTEGCRDFPDPNPIGSPCKTDEDLAKYREECKALIDPRGPFQACHPHEDPITMYNACVFDLCASGGDQQMKDRLFSSYSDDCLEVGIVQAWRDTEATELVCENGVYTACAEQCQPTCLDPLATECLQKQPNQLGNACFEGCVCNDGFVLSGSKCVALGDCGCVFNGRYIEKGFSFGTADCTETCTCVGPYELQCGPTEGGCAKNRDSCKQREDGYFECVEKPRRRATCKAVTDPHYMTFDRKNFDSMGTCNYIMVKNKDDTDLPPFRIVTVNEQPWPNRTVSHVKEAWIHLRDDVTIGMLKGGTITINGLAAEPGTNTTDVEIKKVGRFWIVKFNFGLYVKWDGEDRLRISAWAVLKGKVEGLCGDFDDDESNDFMTPDGVLVENITDFVNSWKVSGYNNDNCRDPANDEPVVLCANNAELSEVQEACSSLVNTSDDSPYKECLGIVNPEKYIEDCIFDLCAYGDLRYKERLFALYVEECRERNVTIRENWRELDSLESYDCEENSHFVNCTNGCEPTCTDRDGSRCAEDGTFSEECAEGCECDFGYVRSGTTCVRESECGCVAEDGSYLQQGFVYRPNNCSLECQCGSNGQITCTEVSGCPKGLRCRVDTDGYKRCIPHIRRRATCKAITDPHYTTFDGVYYDSMGTCAYIMARSKVDSDVEPFRVVAVNERPNANQSVSHVKEIFVHVGNDITVSFKAGPVVTINDEVVLPGSTVEGIAVRQVGRFTVADFPFGIVVRWDGIDRLRVMAWGKLKGKMEGLCGDFNDDETNDLMMPNGQIETDIPTFVNSWKIGGYNTPDCIDARQEDSEPSCPTEERLQEVRESCGVLKDPDGPLGACLDLVDSEATFNSCVIDLCAYDGDQLLRERVISSYADDCREAVSDETPPGELDFRDPEVEELLCRDKPNSKFSSCLDPCQPTCSDRDGSECRANATSITSSCVDGCQCEDGYVLSGNECIRREECGCDIDGRYVPKGYTYNNRNCSVQCTCVGGGEISCTDQGGCEKGFRCRINDEGRRECLKHIRRRATCKAVTDPHYMTFDGKRFDSMGTCAYLMTRSRSDADVPESFRVVAVNEQRDPSYPVSHVREVHVRVGRDFNLVFLPGGGVQINGEDVLPGSQVGPVEIRRVGKFVVADFNFGLVVKWDGNDRLRIMAWAVLKNKVEGVCGDFNDDPENDFTTPSGRIENNIDRFVRTWRVNELSSSRCVEVPELSPGALNDFCNSTENYAEAHERCSVILDPEGNYRDCHAVVEPDTSYDDCMFDVCNTRDFEAANKVIESYTEDCLEETTTTTITNDDVNCPKNFTSSSVMDQCQPTCGDLDASICKENSNLGDHKTLGCVCREGMVLSGDQCVPINECGCLIDGKYRQQGFTYLTEGCETLCECRPGGDVVCNPTGPCSRSQRCEKVNEQYKCMRLVRNQATCKVHTDPHYTTFDGRTFDSSAWCGYTLTQNIPSSDAEQFRVTITNERDTLQRASSRVATVNVDVGEDLRVELRRGGVRVRINDVQYNAGSTVEGIIIRKIGLFTVVEFPFGLVLRWDHQDRLRVTVWGRLQGKVEGLCGRYNDNMNDDFTKPNGDVTDDIEEFVQSWHVRTRSLPKCVHHQDDVNTTCSDPSVLSLYESQCELLLQSDGPFSECHKVVDPQPSFDACVADMCNMDGNPEMKNRVFSSYVHDCLELLREPEPWRDDAGMPITCPANSRFVRCMKQCQPTCGDPDANLCKKKDPFLLGENCVEGCKCISGYILSNDKCVKEEDCGCLVNGVYYVKGFKYRQEGCTQECICRGQNTFVCKDIEGGCLDTQQCKAAPGGYLQCAPRERRRATCKAITDPHYTTFDGTKFDSQGVCSYTMVRSKPEADVDAFSVVAVNEQPKADIRVSHVREVHADFRGHRLSLFSGPIAELDGVRINAGTSQSGMRLERTGRFMTAFFDFGLWIRWDGADRLKISALAVLRGKIEGVCGDFDDDPSNDLTHAISGEITTDPEDFVNSWRVLGFSDNCTGPLADFLSVGPAFVCDPENLMVAEQACAVLKNTGGVLGGCKRLADSETVFENCVLDMCAYAGDAGIHDRVISDFTDDCRSEGGKVPDNWRKQANLTKVECPPHSHFASCMDVCQPTCWDLDGSHCRVNEPSKNCVEGCEADEGYILSGDEYVPIKECGCSKDGKYYKNGESFYTETCEVACTCEEGLVTCRKHSCARGEECTIDGTGKRNCVLIETSKCQVWGSTHISTFDNTTFEVTNNCHYVVAKREQDRDDPSSWDTTFSVASTIQEDDDYVGLTRPHNIRIRIPSQGVTILLRSDSKARIAGKVYHDWKGKDPTRPITVSRRGTYAFVSTFFGLEVAYDGNHLRVTLPTKFSGKIHGLCGNFNGESDDDFFFTDGSPNDDVMKFAQSHSSSSCKKSKSLPEVSCSNEEIQAWGGYDKCGAILDPTSEFANCSTVLDAKKYFDRCVNDVCRSKGSDYILARALKMYAHECASIDMPVCNWRRDYMLQIACPVNSHYDGCAKACEETCGTAEYNECKYQKVEDCVCDEGYIRSNGACIPKTSCDGCTINRKVVPKGFSHRPDGCQKVCTCVGNDIVECEETDGCISRAKCGRDVFGFQQCILKPRNKAVCQAFGNGHILSFDGSRFNSTATCLLTMARSKSDSNITAFSVQADMQPSSNPALSRVAEVIVKVDNDDVILSQGRRVTINGRQVTYGTVMGDISVRKVGPDVAVVFKFGTVLRWDGKQNLRIQARRQLAGQIEGLCGDFDEDEMNDFMTPQGILETDVSVFINSWRNAEPNSGCRLQTTPEEPCDSLEGLAKFKSVCEKKYSSDVTAFAKCNLFEYCLFEMCASGGDIDYIESTIYSFFESCNEEQASIHNVTLDIPKMECPENSRFSDCTSQCQATCSDQDASACLADDSLDEECVPGCQCEDGFVLDGDNCVKSDACGCIGSQGEYYPSGFDSYLEDCDRLCRCNDGVLTCEETKCLSHQYCGQRNGVHGCHWDDECKNNNGDCDHLCNYVEGVVSCSCRDGYNLTSDGRTCISAKSDCDKASEWKSNTVELWINKLDAYMEALKNGTESGQPAHVCKAAWTEWFDTSDPDDMGENESLQRIIQVYPKSVCAAPISIEAQLQDGRSVFGTGLVIRTMSNTAGLQCFHSDQRDGERCADFRVRFLCLEELV